MNVVLDTLSLLIIFNANVTILGFFYLHIKTTIDKRENKFTDYRLQVTEALVTAAKDRSWPVAAVVGERMTKTYSKKQTSKSQVETSSLKLMTIIVH